MPARALDVVTTWRANPPCGAEELRPDLELRVVGFAVRAGRPAAELACKGKFSGAPGGFGLAADVEGRLVVDLASGLVHESRIAGPATASGSVDNGGTKLRVEGTGRVEFTTGAVVGSVSQAPATGEGLDGAWTGADGVAVDVHGDLVLLRRGAEGYAGRLTERGEGSARGEFASRGALHPFELRAAGRDVVALHTGGLALELRRAPRAAGEGNPFGDAVAVAPSPPAADGRADWVEYAHPAGTSMRHPPKWTTDVSPLGVTLVPDGIDRNTELILALGDAAGVESDPLGPHAVATMNGLVRGALPGFTTTGHPRLRASAGSLAEIRVRCSSR